MNANQTSGIPDQNPDSETTPAADIQGCPSIEVFREPDPVNAQTLLISRTPNRGNGKGGGKGGGGKSLRLYVGGRGSTRKKKPKNTTRKSMLKRNFFK